MLKKALNDREVWLSGESEEDDKIRESLVTAQFNRAAYDYRQYDQIIWQIPTVSITITSVTFAVAFSFVHVDAISGIILLLGSFFNLTLAVALAKHRLMQDAISLILRDLEKEYRVIQLPAETDEARDFLESRKHRHPSPAWLRNQSGFKFLLSSVLLMFFAQLAIGVYLLLTWVTTHLV